MMNQVHRSPPIRLLPFVEIVGTTCVSFPTNSSCPSMSVDDDPVSDSVGGVFGKKVLVLELNLKRLGLSASVMLDFFES